jgi:hypothetical protein
MLREEKNTSAIHPNINRLMLAAKTLALVHEERRRTNAVHRYLGVLPSAVACLLLV